MVALCPSCFTALSFQTQQGQSFHSFTEHEVHAQPLLVLACVAPGCVPDFCWLRPARIDMPRKNPALCGCTTMVPYSRASRGHSQKKRFACFPFWRACTVAAMNYCSHFCQRAAQGCFTLYDENDLMKYTATA